MATSPIHDVSDTAFWIAHYRGVESGRADALFADPLAARLAGERGRVIAAAMPMARMTAWLTVIRTVVIDGFIRAAVAQGVDTILNLGAGLDTRPYRMELPAALRWVEADYPHVIAHKEERLAAETPRCRLERVPIDLSDRPARKTLLADVDAGGRRILILTEGVVPYLDVEQAGALADDLRACDHVTSWIVDRLSPESVKYRQRRGPGRMMGNAPFKFAPADWVGFFAQHGWRAGATRYLAEEGDRLGRPVPLPAALKLLIRLGGLFAPPERRGAFKRFAGYTTLEPGPTLTTKRGAVGSESPPSPQPMGHR